MGPVRKSTDPSLTAARTKVRTHINSGRQPTSADRLRRNCIADDSTFPALTGGGHSGSWPLLYPTDCSGDEAKAAEATAKAGESSPPLAWGSRGSTVSPVPVLVTVLKR